MHFLVALKNQYEPPPILFFCQDGRPWKFFCDGPCNEESGNKGSEEVIPREADDIFSLSRNNFIDNEAGLCKSKKGFSGESHGCSGGWGGVTPSLTYLTTIERIERGGGGGGGHGRLQGNFLYTLLHEVPSVDNRGFI